MEYSQIIQERHSVRHFQDKEVERELVDRIVQEAMTAPSSKNSKSSAFMIIEDADTLEALSQMRTFGSALIKGAKAAVVVLGDESKTDLWRENCAISATFLQLSAVNAGLGSCWVHVNGRVRSADGSVPGQAEDYVRELLGIKEGMRVLCVIALGYEQIR
ncbi:MAG: nitroreductase family protein [Bacteroidales bacterium]|nr:nitroreductase family protein [Bacteroidales bacterium]